MRALKNFIITMFVIYGISILICFYFAALHDWNPQDLSAQIYFTFMCPWTTYFLIRNYYTYQDVTTKIKNIQQEAISSTASISDLEQVPAGKKDLIHRYLEQMMFHTPHLAEVKKWTIYTSTFCAEQLRAELQHKILHSLEINFPLQDIYLDNFCGADIVVFMDVPNNSNSEELAIRKDGSFPLFLITEIEKAYLCNKSDFFANHFYNTTGIFVDRKVAFLDNRKDKSASIILL
jgi:hypothetical protein